MGHFLRYVAQRLEALLQVRKAIRDPIEEPDGVKFESDNPDLIQVSSCNAGCYRVEVWIIVFCWETCVHSGQTVKVIFVV